MYRAGGPLSAKAPGRGRSRMTGATRRGEWFRSVPVQRDFTGASQFACLSLIWGSFKNVPVLGLALHATMWPYNFRFDLGVRLQPQVCDDVTGVSLEIFQPAEMFPQFPRVDIKVVVHEYVSESRHSPDPGGEPSGDHSLFGEYVNDVRVSVGLPELSLRDDVAADVQHRLDGYLEQSFCGCPGRAFFEEYALLELPDLLEIGNAFLDLANA